MPKNEEFIEKGGAKFGGAAAEYKFQKQAAQEKQKQGILNLREQCSEADSLQAAESFFEQAINQYIAREAKARANLARAKRSGDQEAIIQTRREIALANCKRKISEKLLSGELNSQSFAKELKEKQPETFDEDMYWQAYNDAVDHIRRYAA